MKKTTKKGFTLVELLVVIAIIAIIAAVAIPVTIGQVKNSKNKTAKQEIATFGKAIETAIGTCSANGEVVNETNVAKAMKVSAPTYIDTFSIDAAGKVITFALKANSGTDIKGTDLQYTLSGDFAGIEGLKSAAFKMENATVKGTTPVVQEQHP